MPSVAFVFTIVLAALFGVSAEASSPRVRDVALAGSDARPATPALLRGGIDAAKALPRDVETGLGQYSQYSSGGGEADGDVFAVTAEGAATCEFYGIKVEKPKCGAAAARMNLIFSSQSAPSGLSLPGGCACSAHEPYRGCWFDDGVDGTSDSAVFLICEVSGDFNDAGAIAAADAADATAASVAIAVRDNGYLVFPAATLVDPSGKDKRTTFASLGSGQCRDAKGRYYVGTVSYTTDPGACGRYCLENFDVVDVVGFDWYEMTSGLCYCQVDATSSGGTDATSLGCESHAEGCGTGPMGNPNDWSGVECFERRYTP